MIVRKLIEIIVPATVYPDKGNTPRGRFLQGFAVSDGNKPVAGSVKDIDRAAHVFDPPVCSQVVAQHITQGQKGQEALDHFFEIVIRCIQYKIAGPVVGGQLGRKAAAQAPALHNEVTFGVLCREPAVNELHVVQHFALAPPPGAFAKTPVVDKHYIIIVPVKILRIPCPALYAPRVAMEVEDQPLWRSPVKMKAIDAHPFCYIEIELPEGYIVPELEVGVKLFRLENKELLQQVYCRRKQGYTTHGVKKYKRQAVFCR